MHGKQRILFTRRCLLSPCVLCHDPFRRIGQGLRPEPGRHRPLSPPGSDADAVKRSTPALSSSRGSGAPDNVSRVVHAASLPGLEIVYPLPSKATSLFQELARPQHASTYVRENAGFEQRRETAPSMIIVMSILIEGREATKKTEAKWLNPSTAHDVKPRCSFRAW